MKEGLINRMAYAYAVCSKLGGIEVHKFTFQKDRQEWIDNNNHYSARKAGWEEKTIKKAKERLWIPVPNENLHFVCTFIFPNDLTDTP